MQGGVVLDWPGHKVNALDKLQVTMSHPILANVMGIAHEMRWRDGAGDLPDTGITLWYMATATQIWSNTNVHEPWWCSVIDFFFLIFYTNLWNIVQLSLSFMVPDCSQTVVIYNVNGWFMQGIQSDGSIQAIHLLTLGLFTVNAMMTY